MKNVLNDTEVKELREITTELSHKYGHSISLDSSLKKWKLFVHECENGYGYCIDDYTNDLSSREIIQEIFENVSSNLADKIKTEVEPIDSHFFKITKSVTVPLMDISNQPTEIEKMLYFRIPQKCVGDLEENLTNMGIMKR